MLGLDEAHNEVLQRLARPVETEDEESVKPEDGVVAGRRVIAVGKIAVHLLDAARLLTPSTWYSN